MARGHRGSLEDLGMIWTLAAKDIVDGLRSKTIWQYIPVVVLIIVGYRYMPVLGQMGEVEVVVYDKGESRLVDAMTDSGKYEVRLATSMQEFEGYMDDADEGEYGLVIPAAFDESLASGAPIQLEAYVLWSSRLKAETLERDFEDSLSDLMGTPVDVELGSVIVPASDSMGNVRTIALVPLLTVIIVGMMTVPQLMLEEKATRTLDTLLVSPARIGHVVAGKALAGAVYCLGTGIVALAFNWIFVVDWGLAILGLLGSTLFGVGLGLALGSLLAGQKQIALWAMILFQPILMPLVLYTIEPVFPPAVRNALPWIPPVTLLKLFHQSLTNAGASNIGAMHLLTLAGSIMLLFALVIWKLRRSNK